MSEADIAAVALGANLGPAERNVRRALVALASLPDTRMLARSSLYRTRPWGRCDQPSFVNAVALLATGLRPRALWRALLAIEAAFGRVRDGSRWGPRSLDLDLLVHGDRPYADGDLILPHPRLRERGFVLVPLNEIAPTLSIPGVGTAKEALLALSPSVGECECLAESGAL